MQWLEHCRRKAKFIDRKEMIWMEKFEFGIALDNIKVVNRVFHMPRRVGIMQIIIDNWPLTMGELQELFFEKFREELSVSVAHTNLVIFCNNGLVSKTCDWPAQYSPTDYCLSIAKLGDGKRGEYTSEKAVQGKKYRGTKRKGRKTKPKTKSNKSTQKNELKKSTYFLHPTELSKRR
jgi:hypothetical protein